METECNVQYAALSPDVWDMSGTLELVVEGALHLKAHAYPRGNSIVYREDRTWAETWTAGALMGE